MNVQKFVVCKGYYGLGGNIAVLLCAKRISEILGRKLLVDWKDNRNYGLSNSDIFTELFSPSNISSLNQSLSGKSIWPSYWSQFIDQTQPYSSEFPLSTVRTTDLEGISSSELQDIDVIVITRDDKYWHSHEYLETFSQISKCLIPNNEISREIDDFVSENFQHETIGVHFRHGNGEKTVVPPDINWFFEKIDEISDGLSNYRIFLCTDCSAVVSKFEDRFPGIVVHKEKQFLPLGSGGMHYAQGDEEKLRSAKEALIDIWLLSRCNMLLGSKSFFSRLAIVLGSNDSILGHHIWNPIHRSHRPLQGHQPITSHSGLNELFEKSAVPTDGVFINSIENKYEIFYLFEKICTFSSLDQLNIDSVFEKIERIRLY